MAYVALHVRVGGKQLKEINKMKMPPLKSGITGFTNEHGDFVCTGSATGRHSSPPGPCTPGAKFHLARIPIDSGGYDPGGAYFGLGGPLYRAYSSEGNGEEVQECFCRAENREAAKRYVGNRFLGAKFYR